MKNVLTKKEFLELERMIEILNIDFNLCDQSRDDIFIIIGINFNAAPD